MDDRTFAKQQLTENKFSLCVIKNENLVFSSSRSSVLPLYTAYTDGLDFSSCAAADKVVGLGAAIFWEKLNITSLHANIISQPALDYLNKYDIDISYDILTNGIQNRTKDGFCPIETLAKQTDTFEAFLKGVKTFLTEKGLLS